MSRQMKIVNGPNFRQIISRIGIFSEETCMKMSIFTMNKEVLCRTTPNEKVTEYHTMIDSIGRVYQSPDQFVLVARMSGEIYTFESVSVETWFYIMHYNINTRKGHCVEYSEEEFFTSDVVTEMFQQSIFH